MHKGACLCGTVSFEVSGDLSPPDACHCSQCRKHTGHFLASTDVSHEHLTVEGAGNITWYHSSEKVRRGFCSKCGSTLFWDPIEKGCIAVAMGAFDQPTNTELDKQIHVADKGDYYKIGDGLQQNQH